MGKLMGLVNCAGIAVGRKDGGQERRRTRWPPSPRTVTINLVGSFNMIRLAAEAMSRTSRNPPASAAC
jgi:NAD(P)-dependent dehydrogenase (short-subunit alcohol dehydrogenase family)